MTNHDWLVLAVALFWLVTNLTGLSFTVARLKKKSLSQAADHGGFFNFDLPLPLYSYERELALGTNESTEDRGIRLRMKGAFRWLAAMILRPVIAVLRFIKALFDGK